MESFKSIVNFLTDPKILITTSMVVFLSALFSRKVWTPIWAKFGFGGLALFMLLSVKDENFRKIVTAPDNIPIVGMLFLVGFFVWYALYKAKMNDDRLDQGLPVREVEE